MHQRTNSTQPQPHSDSATQLLSGRDVLATDEHLPVFWPHFHSACAETATSELPVKILTSSLDSAKETPLNVV